MVEERTTYRTDRHDRPAATARALKRTASRLRRGVARIAAFAAALALGTPLLAAPLEPPPQVARLLEAPPLPKLALGPDRRHALLVHEHELLPTELLAEPTVSVVGLKVNPRTYGRHAPLAYFGLTLVDLHTGARSELDVPANAILGFPIWSPDGSRFAFTATVDSGIELWVGDPVDGRVR